MALAGGPAASACAAKSASATTTNAPRSFKNKPVPSILSPRLVLVPSVGRGAGPGRIRKSSGNSGARVEKPAGPTSYVLGDWTFLPASNELARAEGGAPVRLEHRTSDVLRILCERRGAVVSHEDLL